MLHIACGYITVTGNKHLRYASLPSENDEREIEKCVYNHVFSLLVCQGTTICIFYTTLDSQSSLISHEKFWQRSVNEFYSDTPLLAKINK